MDWRNGSLYFLWLVLGLASINGYAEKKVVCYYTNWSIYRPGTAKFSPENINPYLCTHLIYAFGGFTKDNTLKPFDKYQDIEKGGYAKFNGLKTYNKKLKTMLAIGGWNEGSTRFSPMVADPERRRALVKNAVKFLRQNHFDGLDLDWEYPAFRDGGKPRDKNNYADLVQELRQEFERESSKTGRPRLLLSMAIPAGIEYLEKGYDLARLNEYLDFFNLLSYDYHSAFEPAVNHHSPLYGLEEDNEYNYDNELTVDFTMSYLLKHHVSPDKLILGIPTYGRSYTLYNQDATAIGSPADGPGEEGDATREKGYLAYYEICANVKSSQWEVVQPNPKAMGPYAFKGNQWVGYDDEDIVKMKSLYVVEKNLGGIMFWAIDNDDFRGNCHGRPYPLIEAAKEALLGAIENEQTTQKPKSGLRKKTRPQLSSQRSNDSNNRRARPEKQRPTTTQSPRKRVSQRTESNARNRGSSEENEDRKVEDEGNAVRETSGQWKSNQRNRSSKGTNRRKVQTTERYEEPIEEEARESTSGRLTTPEPPTTPDPGSDFKCEDEGFFSHPRDCKKYFWCLDSGPGGLGIVAHQFTCPSGLVFNKAADSCDYPRNVVCPKAKTKAATTTPKAPVTTTSRPTTTTRRTTTTEETNSAEEYEYEEDENATDEEIIEEIKSTTSRPLIYKTISRNKPTTMTTEATEAPTTNPPRIFKPNSAKVFDLEDEEDPRVIKELIELIKKAGGLEQLERQLNIQEKSPMRKSDTGDDGPVVTPATISRSLYERVLSRQANKVNHLFGPTTQRTTTEESKKTKSETQNGPGGAQFEGLDDVPEVKSLRRTKKPQYVTIERQRPSTTPVFEDEFDEEELADESSEEDNADVASSEEQTVSDLPESRKDSAKKVTPNYVNILRSRPTTSAYENDLDVRDEAKEKEAKFSQENSDKTENESFSRQRPVISSSNDDVEKETVVPKNRYTNTQRFRSTTLRTDESTAFTESIKPSEKTTTEIVNPTTPAINQERKELISETLAFSTLPVSTIEFSSTPVAETSKQPSTATEVISGSKATISTTHLPLAESTIEEVENLVTEIPMTTQPTTRATQASRTTAVSQPRPFGFPRRGRPTTTTASPTVASTTDQSRVKVSTRPTRNFARTRTRSKPSELTIENQNHLDAEVSDDNLSENVKPKPVSSSRSRFVIRRGGSRFSTQPSNVSESFNDFSGRRRTRPTTTTTTTTTPAASESTPAESRPTSQRRRGRPTTTTTTPIPDSTTQSNNNRRRRPTTPVTDSPIFRIVPQSVQEPVLNYSRLGSNTNEDSEKITNLKILKLAEYQNDSLNAIEFTTPENETSKQDLDSATESTTLITSPDPFTKYTTADYSTLTTVDAEESEGEQKQTKKKVLLRKRPVSDDNSSEDTLKRRRKIIRRLGPVSQEENLTTTSGSYVENNEVITTTESFNTLNDQENSTVEATTVAMDTQYTTTDMETTTVISSEENTTLISNDIDAETTTVNSMTTDDSSEIVTTTVVTTTVAPSTTEKVNTRFVRRKFVRKRPVGYSASSTTPTRRFGFPKSTTEVPTSSFAPSKRRKNLFVRRRPLPSTTSSSSESFENDEDNEFNTVTVDVKTSSVSVDTDNFWKHYTTFAPQTITPSSQQPDTTPAINDSSPERSTEKPGEPRQTRINSEIKDEIAESSKTSSPQPSSSATQDKPNLIANFWQSLNTKNRSYLKRTSSSTTTDASVTETLVPSKKFDYIADAIIRKHQSQTKATTKSSIDDDNSLELEHTTPLTKPQVTRLVTSVVESGTTERQIILIKTKYSSQTSMTKFPIDNPLNALDQQQQQQQQSPLKIQFSDEPRNLINNHINESTEKTPEKSTLPIETEFARRPRFFTTESTVESSTIAIESVFNNLINKNKNKLQL